MPPSGVHEPSKYRAEQLTMDWNFWYARQNKGEVGLCFANALKKDLRDPFSKGKGKEKRNRGKREYIELDTEEDDNDEGDKDEEEEDDRAEDSDEESGSEGGEDSSEDEEKVTIVPKWKGKTKATSGWLRSNQLDMGEDSDLDLKGPNLGDFQYFSDGAGDLNFIPSVRGSPSSRSPTNSGDDMSKVDKLVDYDSDDMHSSRVGTPRDIKSFHMDNRVNLAPSPLHRPGITSSVPITLSRPTSLQSSGPSAPTSGAVPITSSRPTPLQSSEPSAPTSGALPITSSRPTPLQLSGPSAPTSDRGVLAQPKPHLVAGPSAPTSIQATSSFTVPGSLDVVTPAVTNGHPDSPSANSYSDFVRYNYLRQLCSDIEYQALFAKLAQVCIDILHIIL